MDWISVKDELPEDKTMVIIAILSRYQNAPAEYAQEVAVYRSGDYHNWRCMHSVGNSFDEPTHWQPFPQAPPIEYKNKPEDCKHCWEENSDNRFCFDCGTVQKKKKTEWVE